MGNCVTCRYAIRDPKWTDYKCALKHIDIPDPEEMGCLSYQKDMRRKPPPPPPGRRPPKKPPLNRPGDKKIVENGTFYADGDNMTGYRSVTVDIPEPVILKKVITKNGRYVPDDDVAGYNPVIVNVTPVLQEKTIDISKNGTYTIVAEPGFDGLVKIVINVDIDGVISTTSVVGKAIVGYAIVGRG